MSKSWLITGTSSGLGYELTRQLLARGDRVAATLRKPGPLDDLKKQYGDALWIGYVDVTDRPALRELVDSAFAEFGKIDAVVGNAGYGLFGAVEEFTDAQIERQIATNFTAAVHFARAAIPHLRNQGGGSFVQIGSAYSQIAAPGAAIYAATKWAVDGFIEGLAAEVAGFGVRVSVVEPGTIRTAFAGTSLDAATPTKVYEEGLVGQIRASMAGYQAIGDPAKMAKAIIESVDGKDLPLRLLLGSDAYPRVLESLKYRINSYEAQRDVALSTDI